MQKPPPRLLYIRKLCAHLPEQEIVEAEARFIRYIETCIETGAKLPVGEDLGSGFDSFTDQSYDDQED